MEYTVPHTIEDVRELLAKLKEEIKSREYNGVTTKLEIDSDSIGAYRFNLNARSPEGKMVYGGARGDTIDEALSKTIESLKQDFPPRNVLLKREFVSASETLAGLAEKIGETAPDTRTAEAYAQIAETLREHLRSNLLEVS